MSKERTVTPEERREWRQEVGAEPRDPAPRAEESVSSSTPALKKLLPPLEVLTGKEAQRALKPFGRTQATLDLHGVSKLDAYEQVSNFVRAMQAAGARHVTIITGKGRTSEGVLRANLPHWLNEPHLRRLIGAMAIATPDKGGSGALHVLLKK